MGKKKKIPTNSFYYFMQDYKKTHNASNLPLNEVAALAGPIWEKMNRAEREPYEQLVKTIKGGSQVKKYDSRGVDIEVIKRQENEKYTKDQMMKDDIRNTLKLAIESGQIKKQEFLIMHVNHYCMYTTDRLYVPAEIGITRFNLENGVDIDNTFHAIVKPGPLRIGYAAIAKQISEESHELKPPNSLDTDGNNLDHVMQGVVNYILGRKFDGIHVPPVYAHSKNFDIIENVFANYIDQSKYKFKVYSMEYFFYQLRNIIGESVGNHSIFKTISICTLELEKDVYDFCSDIACEYHTLGRPNHCSKSYVIRYAYVICDHCCGDLGIQLIPGKHVPRQARVMQLKPPSYCGGTYAQSSGSVAGSSSFRTKLEMDEACSIASSSDTFTLDGSDSDNQDPEDVWSDVVPKHKSMKKGYNPSQNEASGWQMSNSSTSNFDMRSQQSDEPLRRPRMLSGASMFSGQPHAIAPKGRGSGLCAKYNLQNGPK